MNSRGKSIISKVISVVLFILFFSSTTLAVTYANDTFEGSMDGWTGTGWHSEAGGYSGSYAAYSGSPGDSANYTMTKNVTCSSSCIVKFFWGVSSEAGFDYSAFYIDGTLYSNISGDVSWARKLYNLDAGTHSFEFAYSKDGSELSGNDTAFVDQFTVQEYADQSIVGFQSISASAHHSCGILENGTAYCWGRNEYGQLGYGDVVYQYNPIAVNLPSSFKEIYAAGHSYYHSCGLLANGSAYCWGELQMNGEDFLNPSAVNTTLLFTSISSSGLHTCGIATNGTLYCWGSNTYGQIGYGSHAQNEEVVDPVAVNTSETFKSVSAGYFHTCGIIDNGSAYCFGVGVMGELGYGDDISQDNPIAVNISETFKNISAGYDHTCGILTNGSVYCWGSNTYGQLGLGKWSNTGNFSPVAVNTSATFKSISAGMYYTCGIATNGTAYCWGIGTDGVLGYGGTDEKDNPTAVNMPVAFKSIDAGSYHTCGVLANDTGYCWGFSRDGQIGCGNCTDEDGIAYSMYSPVPVNFTYSPDSSGYSPPAGNSQGIAVASSPEMDFLAVLLLFAASFAVIVKKKN